MSSGFRRYVLFVCLPAALLTAGGLALLGVLRAQMVAAQSDAYGREAARQTRSVDPEKFDKERRAVFEWSPSAGLLRSANLAPELAAAIDTTNDIWRAEGRKAKSPKTGWMMIAGHPVAWCRLQEAMVVGYELEPFADTAAGQRLPLFTIGFVMVALFAFAIIAGGYSMLREMERERRENTEKISFLSNATHELKTPLAAIRLWSEMLSSGRLGEERSRHAIEVIEEENARMIRLVENLLDFSRLEQKRRRYREEDADVRKIVDDAVDFLHGEFEKNGIAVRGDESVPARIDADAVRQIILNLLGNAAKYAAANGPVDVGVTSASGHIRIEIADRGPGIPPDELPRVFDRFFRGAAAAESPGGGLGLGLAISRGLALGMCGSLSASPRPGGGAIFTLELPARVGEKQT